jgi:8-oxo-dGTP pyrophosphatase MutT (NUDIX family)
MIKEWELVDSQIDKDYNVFQIRTKTARSPRTNRVGTFYVIEADDWVNIIPLTRDGKVVMIRQYRHGSTKVTLEIPGGVVEEASSEKAALRELMEETGYMGNRVRHLGTTNPNPAIFSNLCHTYLVENAEKIADSNLDPDEDIDVVLIPLEEIPALVREGAINHALVIVAFHFFNLQRS